MRTEPHAGGEPRRNAAACPSAAHWLRLMQLSSSSFPIGAFAYSQGLEAAVEHGWVYDEASLASWVCGVGEQTLARLDLPLLVRAHDAWSRADTGAALAIGERVLSNREARELWEQERRLGSALAAALVTLGVPRAAAILQQPALGYVIAYALGASHFGIAPHLAALGYAYSWSEQQVNAATRVLPLGHMAAQRVLSRVLELVPTWVGDAARLEDDEIGSSTLALAMAAAWHEEQYSRLFRS